jgi:hypothetical protein
VERRGAGDPGTLVALGAAVALLAVFALTQHRSRSPLLPLRLLRQRPLASANVLIVANAGVWGSLIVLSTLLMQRELGFSALATGVAFLPLALSALAGGLLAPAAIARLGEGRTVALSLLASAASLAWVARDPSGLGYWQGLLPAYVVSGAPFAMAAVPLTALAVGHVRTAERALAAGLFQTATHVGGAAVLAVVVVAAAESGLQTGFLVAVGLLVGAAGSAAVLLRGTPTLGRDVVAESGAG